MRLLDANIFLRYLAPAPTPTDQRKARACLALFQRLRTGEESAWTIEAIITEVCYVLRSPRQYGLAPADIAARLRPLLALRGLKVPHKRTIMRALEIWVLHPTLDFEDALAIAHMERRGMGEIVSYDTDFDRIAGITRIEP